MADARPEACPAALVADVGELGVLHVRIAEEGPRTFAVVVEGDVAGRSLRRAFTTTSCTTAHAVSGVVVASVRAALDRAERTQRAAEPELLVPLPPADAPAPTPAPTPTAAPVPTQTPIAATNTRPPKPVAARAAPRPRLALAGEGGLAFGILPSLAGTVGVRVAVLVARWRAEIAGGWLVRQRTAADDGAAVVQLWSVEARGAFVPRVRIVEFPIHAGVVLGDLVARGLEVDGATTGHAFWGAGIFGAGVAVVPVPRVAIGVEAAGLVAFSRPTFTFGRADDAPLVVHRPGQLGVRALLRVEIRLP